MTWWFFPESGESVSETMDKMNMHWIYIFIVVCNDWDRKKPSQESRDSSCSLFWAILHPRSKTSTSNSNHSTMGNLLDHFCQSTHSRRRSVHGWWSFVNVCRWCSMSFCVRHRRLFTTPFYHLSSNGEDETQSIIDDKSDATRATNVVLPLTRRDARTRITWDRSNDLCSLEQQLRLCLRMGSLQRWAAPTFFRSRSAPAPRIAKPLRSDSAPTKTNSLLLRSSFGSDSTPKPAPLQLK